MGEDDYWTNYASGAHDAKPAEIPTATVYRVAPFEPKLPTSDGAQKLLDILFSDVEGNLSCYALLDASWVFGLQERLIDTGLEASPLFTGDAADELGDVSPWLIKLAADAPFTRELFTHSAANWHNWDDEPGIFILSDATFGEVKKQLRKFTKLRQSDGRWVYFRYWDPELLVLLTQARLPHAVALFSGHFDVVARFGHEAHILHGRNTAKLPSPGALTYEQRSLVAGTYTNRRCRGIADSIRAEFHDDVVDYDDAALTQEVRDALNAASDFGLRDGQVRAKFTIMAVATVPGFHKSDHIKKMFEKSDTPEQTFRDLSDVIRKRIKHIDVREL